MICAPTTDNATWCLTPASRSAERRFAVAVVKKCITGSSSNNGESAPSTRTSAPATALARPSPVSESTPDRREAAITSCPCALSLVATFEPISPRPPMITIFMINLSELRLPVGFGAVPANSGDRVDLQTDQGLHRPGASVAFRSELSTPFGLVLVGCPTGRGLRLHADELEAEIAQPVEKSI